MPVVCTFIHATSYNISHWWPKLCISIHIDLYMYANATMRIFLWYYESDLWPIDDLKWFYAEFLVSITNRNFPGRCIFNWDVSGNGSSPNFHRPSNRLVKLFASAWDIKWMLAKYFAIWEIQILGHFSFKSRKSKRVKSKLKDWFINSSNLKFEQICTKLLDNNFFKTLLILIDRLPPRSLSHQLPINRMVLMKLLFKSAPYFLSTIKRLWLFFMELKRTRRLWKSSN